MSHNEDFENVMGQIMIMNPLPLVNKAYNLVRLVEKQKQITCHTVEPTVFFSNQNSNYNGRK